MFMVDQTVKVHMEQTLENLTGWACLEREKESLFMAGWTCVMITGMLCKLRCLA